MAKLHRVAAVALAAGCGLSAPAALAGPWGGFDIIASDASGVAAGFVSGGTGTALPPQPIVFGVGDWPYHHSESRAALSETLLIASAGQPIASLQVTAGQTVLGANSTGFSAGTVTASGNGSIGSVQITLQQYPPPPTGPLPAPLLSIVASDAAWQASDTAAVHATPVVAGTASFGSLTITGSLINNSTISETGTQAPNESVDFIVAGGGNVRITLNQQVTAGAVSCVPTCTFTPSGITVDALSIHLDQVAVAGQTVSGDITLGEAGAQIIPLHWPPVSAAP